jgi:signal transduction histidine kinase
MRFVVRDDGRGLTADQVNRVSSGQSLAGPSRGVSGVGIGLAIARKMTELHGGKLWAESEGAGRGAVFYVELPIPQSRRAAG